MAFVIDSVLFVLNIFISLTAAQVCDPGWFGHKCMYKCHCAQSATCLPSGDCLTRERCEVGFFGPGCQYVDVARSLGLDQGSYLVDNSDETCNTNSNSRRIELALSEEVVFMWIRIHFRLKHRDLDFKIILNNDMSCKNEKRFVVAPNVLDIVCGMVVNFEKLKVIGYAAADVCSVYISGGRNTALKQQTSQSTTFIHSGVRNHTGYARLAVDSNTNADSIYGASCSHTNNELHAHWNLTYNRPQSLTRIVIYNRSGLERRLVGFTLKLYSESGTEIFSYKDKSTVGLSIYSVVVPSGLTTSSLKIMQDGVNLPVFDRFLTLCEVETFGEPVCPEQMYGLWCQKRCTCSGGDICNTVNGLCVQGCSQGVYGAECTARCNSNCEDNVCYADTGSCISCIRGFTGRACETKCPEGFYGRNCSEMCSENCIGECNNQNGDCKCKGNFGGRNCRECLRGFHGSTCNLNCSDECADNICYRTSGFCVRCNGDRQGPFCAYCEKGRFGVLCYSYCSSHCKNSICDAADGRCSNCTDNYTGPKCAIGNNSF